MNDQMVAWNIGYVVAIGIGVALFAYGFASRRKGPGEEKLDVYRRVRDEIRRFVETLPEALKST